MSVGAFIATPALRTLPSYLSFLFASHTQRCLIPLTVRRILVNAVTTGCIHTTPPPPPPPVDPYSALAFTMPPVHPARIHQLKAGVEPKKPTHILYWTSTALRVRDNPSLHHAATLSNLHRIPLHVTTLLDSTAPDGNPLPERHALFLLQSVRDLHAALHDIDVPLTVLKVEEVKGGDAVSLLLAEAKGAAAVVADIDYLRRGRALRNRLANKLSIPFYVIEANVVVPLHVASEKAEHAARTIRPKISRVMQEFLHLTPDVTLQHQPVGYADSHSSSRNKPILFLKDDNDIQQTLEAWDGIDREATRVPMFPGGERAAQKLLATFVKGNLATYSNGRNEPALSMQSDLSPHLRIGTISPVDITLAVRSATTGSSKLREGRDVFLEELIIRRELSANACWFNEGYDEYTRIVPTFAQTSLKLHMNDTREHIYTYDELEAAVTHDIYWNAAQLELIARGKMHGYMRMYWAKQVIGWVKDPEDAFKFLLRLNNRWELDAVDPNSYVGVAWCFGLHDRGWTERPVWGKVRFMNQSGLNRKFNMPAYVAMVDKLVEKYGIPTHIEQLRKQRNMKGRQSTIAEAFGRKKKRAKRS